MLLLALEQVFIAILIVFAFICTSMPTKLSLESAILRCKPGNCSLINFLWLRHCDEGSSHRTQFLGIPSTMKYDRTTSGSNRGGVIDLEAAPIAARH